MFVLPAGTPPAAANIPDAHSSFLFEMRNIVSACARSTSTIDLSETETGGLRLRLTPAEAAMPVTVVGVENIASELGLKPFTVVEP